MPTATRLAGVRAAGILLAGVIGDAAGVPAPGDRNIGEPEAADTAPGEPTGPAPAPRAGVAGVAGVGEPSRGGGDGERGSSALGEDILD